MKLSSVFYYCLGLLLFINSNLSLQYQNNQFSNANANLNEDTLLICTGRESILISSYEYFTNNKIVKVEQLGDNSTTNYCPIDTAIEPSKFETSYLKVVQFTRGTFTLFSEKLLVLLNQLAPVNQKLTRAPPFS